MRHLNGDEGAAKSAGNNGITAAHVYKNPYVLYMCFLAVVAFSYFLHEGSFQKVNANNWINYFATMAESGGLLVLRQSILQRNSVRGISGMSMLMFAMVYTSRMWELFPPLRMRWLHVWVLWLLCLVSLFQVIELVYKIFVSHKKTYDADADTPKVRTLVPASVALALLVHPTFKRGLGYSIIWSVGFYLDVAALVPQVVMMSCSGAVEARVAHFVAATTVSRVVDLYWWYRNIELGPQGYLLGFNYSGWLIVIVHVLNLLLVIDFMYYYMKARLSGSSFSEDLDLSVIDDIMV